MPRTTTCDYDRTAARWVSWLAESDEAGECASNYQRTQFNGAEQLQFQFVSNPTKRGRGVLVRTYQSLGLG